MSEQYEFPEPPQKRKRSPYIPEDLPQPRRRARWPWAVFGCMLTCCIGICAATCLLGAGVGTLASRLDSHHLSTSGSETVDLANLDGELYVDVRNPWGNVDIKTWDRDEVLVDYVIDARAIEQSRSQRMLDQINVNATLQGNTVVVRALYSGVSIIENGTVNLTITIPREAHLSVFNVAGALTIRDLHALSLDLETTAGGNVEFHGSLEPGGQFDIFTSMSPIFLYLPADTTFARLYASAAESGVTVDSAFDITNRGATDQDWQWAGVLLGNGTGEAAELRLRTNLGEIQILPEP